jgi:CDP-glucose 4,6-dehydratase
LAERLAADPSLRGQTFNFSNEAPIKVLDLVLKILSLMQREDLKPQIQNEVSNEILHQYLDATKAKKELGWQPRFSLEEGMGKTIHWYEEFFKIT